MTQLSHVPKSGEAERSLSYILSNNRSSSSSYIKKRNKLGEGRFNQLTYSVHVNHSCSIHRVHVHVHEDSVHIICTVRFLQVFQLQILNRHTHIPPISCLFLRLQYKRYLIEFKISRQTVSVHTQVLIQLISIQLYSHTVVIIQYSIAAVTIMNIITHIRR